MSAATPTVGLKRSLLTLVATPNGAATEVLAAALRSSSPTARVGAAKGLAARSDEDSHRQLLLKLGDSQADVRRAVATPVVAKRLRPVVIQSLQGDDQVLCRRACRYAIDADDHHTLGPIVDTAIRPDHHFAAGLCSAALRLARSLATTVEAKRLGEAVPEDPAFARRSAMISLGNAVDRFQEHQNLELVDAFLTLTTSTNSVLKRILGDEQHAAHRVLLDGLRSSHGFGAMDVLIQSIEDADALPLVLDIACERSDQTFTERLLRHVGPRPGVRAIYNAKKLKGFAWGSPKEREKLLQLTPAEQSAAMRLQTACDTDKADRIALASMLLREGGDLGRVAACEAIRRVKAPEIEGLLELGLKDTFPEVVAVSASQLRRQNYPNALKHLVSLLDHSAEVVVKAAQKALGEFSFESYRDVFEKLSPEQRSLAGRLVGRADPEAIEYVLADLKAPSAERRHDALELIHQMAVVDRVLDQVIAAIEDSNTLVRVAAATALGGSNEQRAIEALTNALDDKQPPVVAAAEAGLRSQDSLNVAQNLLSHLQAQQGSSEG